MILKAGLKRNEILRGFGVIEEVLANSRKITSEDLTAHLNFTDNAERIPVKVGFVVSKKKLEKLTTGTG
jgi:hypothetical protein